MLSHLMRKAMAALPFAVRYELFYQAGKSLGVEAYSVNGAAGPYLGALSDQTIIKTYLKVGRLWQQRAELDILRGFFRGRSGTLIDIGANIGAITIPMAQDGLSVIALEPDAINAALLRANVARNCDGCDVRVLRKAVYRERAILRFDRSDHNAGDHHLAADGAHQVEAIALDDLDMPDALFAIKIDTQGAEPGIFAGGRRTLARAGLVLCEFWPAGMRRMGNTPEPIFETVAAAPHGRIVFPKPGDWTTGAALARQLQAVWMGESDAARDGIDFIIASEPF